MRLHNFFRSSSSIRVRAALNLKGLAYDYVPYVLRRGDTRQPAFLALNPAGLVPALELDDGSVLTQSLAIVEWLDETHPAPSLLSRDPATRAGQRARALVIAADTHPLDNLRVLRRLESQFGADQAQRDEWYRHWVIEGLDALAAMAPAGDGFLGGAAPDLSDVCLVPQLYNAARFGLPSERWPRLAAAEAAMLALPAVRAAGPEAVRPAT